MPLDLVQPQYRLLPRQEEVPKIPEVIKSANLKNNIYLGHNAVYCQNANEAKVWVTAWCTET